MLKINFKTISTQKQKTNTKTQTLLSNKHL